MPSSLRIVVLSHRADRFTLIHSSCAEAGHRPVAYGYARSPRPGQAIGPAARTTVAGILDAIPPGVDLLLPGSVTGLGDALRGCRPDLVVCNGFPWKIPASVLEIPRLGIMNLHPSLLPKYRGPLPIPWAIRNGDPDFGVTIHWMDENFDTGRIIIQQGGIPLDDEIVPEQVFARVGTVIRGLLPVALARAAAGFPGDPQHQADASYAGQMEPDFWRVDWSRRAVDIHNQVRAARFLSATDGPVALVRGAWVRIARTRTSPGDGVRVECADGPLWIIEATPAR